MAETIPPQPVLITGATSPIAAAYAAICAKRGQRIALAGRDAGETERIAQDLRIRFGALVTVLPYDAALPGSGTALAKQACEEGIIQAVAFHGVMGDKGQFSHMMQVNCLSVAELFEVLLAEADKVGRRLTLAAISSVAGDRGRQSNYPYGSTKAALDAYLSGLRNRAHHLGHAIITIKPGFVRTRMTDGKVNPQSPLLAEPTCVAAEIDRAIRRRASLVYTPWFWSAIMWIIRAIPEPIFKRMKL
jgi:decaprenylphospho-beta-D-erythro-pentofuranosid-2-ulose 2-reductase